jgi:quercetin dioxygenase-like cupin family protein
MLFKKSIDGQTAQKKDYSKTLLLSLDELGKYPGHAIQTVTIPPHTKQRKHMHHIQTEVAYILSGHATYYVNDIPHEMSPGDIIVDEPKESHFIDNNSDENFALVVFKINMPKNSDDTTWLER